MTVDYSVVFCVVIPREERGNVRNAAVLLYPLGVG